MKIIGITGFGGPEVLGVHEVQESHAGAAAVRIRVRAAGVNPADIMLRAGMISPLDAQPPWALGMDASGVIDEVGDGSRWAVGERVMGMALPFSEHGGLTSNISLRRTTRSRGSLRQRLLSRPQRSR